MVSSRVGLKKETIDGIHRANHSIHTSQDFYNKIYKEDFIVMYCYEYGYGQNLLLIDREAVLLPALTITHFDAAYNSKKRFSFNSL